MLSFSKKWVSALAILVMGFGAVTAQHEPNPFDFGKMWTFENPPVKWFKEAYNFDPGKAWFDEGRLAALRFAMHCSASFVSPDGLVMTNHHCAESVVYELQQEGENFDANGFYARTLADERRNPELFVEQLVQTDDITDRVKAATASATTDDERNAMALKALGEIEREYQSKPGWENLRIVTVPFYSGARYSIYGYKRFSDVRLVFLPETQIGFFGGDPDNFTFPRYNLDYSFWRVYDENGKPYNSSKHYFKFNPNGIEEGTPVFVIGNPGSTERYRTVSQLESDRDYRYPADIDFLTNRMKLLEKKFAMEPDDETRSMIFSLANSIKAIQGTLDGLKDPELFARKVKMEQKIRANAPGKTYWDDMAKYYNEISGYYSELRFLAPSSLSGKTLPLIHTINQYVKTATANPESSELETLEKRMEQLAVTINDPAEVEKFAMVLGELQKYAQPNDKYIHTILAGRTPEKAAADILNKTVFADEKDLSKLLDKKTKKFLRKKDPLIDAAELLGEEYQKAQTAYQSTAMPRKNIEQKVAGEAFKVFGDALPPDATFTLRISDGVVKGYDYNGTQAPVKTTFYGLYDRYYSNDGKFPWSLPERWLNPPADLLKTPINFVCTADIVGGNSGSPIINMKNEAVGLAFDGNIESLPGKFIFDEKYNRTVGVHAGGIIASLRYIYRADRLVAELLGE